MNILQKIFIDHYEEIEYILHPRPVVMENIEKKIYCGDPSFGGAMYGCSHCGEIEFVPFRCHSKFCPTSDNKYCIDRSTKMTFKLLGCTHRHVEFIEELRQKYIKNPPEGMTARLLKNMTDSDLLDMHYFLTEDDDLDEDEFKEDFYIF